MRVASAAGRPAPTPNLPSPVPRGHGAHDPRARRPPQRQEPGQRTRRAGAERRTPAVPGWRGPVACPGGAAASGDMQAAAVEVGRTPRMSTRRAGGELRAAAYVRVSSEEQVDGHSLDAQRRAIAAACEERGWRIVEWYA